MQGVPLHPTQLYASLAEFALLVLLLWLLHRPHLDGEVLGAWLFLAGLSNFLLTFLRGDSGPLVSGLIPAAQLVSASMVLAGGILWLHRGQPQNTPPAGAIDAERAAQRDETDASGPLSPRRKVSRKLERPARNNHAPRTSPSKWGRCPNNHRRRSKGRDPQAGVELDGMERHSLAYPGTAAADVSEDHRPGHMSRRSVVTSGFQAADGDDGAPQRHAGGKCIGGSRRGRPRCRA